MFSEAALLTSFPIKFFQSIASNPHPHILFKNYTSNFKQKIFAYLFQQNIEEKHYCFLGRVLNGWNTQENKTFYIKTPSWNQMSNQDLTSQWMVFEVHVLKHVFKHIHVQF